MRLWIAGNPDLKGGARLEGPPRRIDTVQGVYLGPGAVGVRQVGLGVQAPGELGGEKHARRWQWGQWPNYSHDFKGE